jgi:hypothetical protein
MEKYKLDFVMSSCTISCNALLHDYSAHIVALGRHSDVVALREQAAR